MTALTLITSVLNAGSYIDDMFASVPKNNRIEHIVIDAGSTDGTLEKLKRRSGIKLIVRPGMPLYEALNEAVGVAVSPYIALLNADDELPADAMEVILEELAKPGELDILCGEAEAFIDVPEEEAENRRVVRRYCGQELTGLRRAVLIFGAPIINAKIFRRELILESGGFDERFAFAADRELLLRLILKHHDLKWRCVAKPFYRYRIHPSSKTLRQTPHRRIEIAQEHGRIATRFAADKDIDTVTCRLLRAWATHETAVIAVRGVGAGNYGAAAAAVGQLALSAPRAVRELALAARERRNLSKMSVPSGRNANDMARASV